MPDEAEIFRARVFDEPLIPNGGQPSAAETAALADALTKYGVRSGTDDFSALTDFLAAFPNSVWTPSLLLHLGAEYYNTGRYSKALEAWEQAWQEFSSVTNGPAKAQADRALGELAHMCSKLGRMKELKELLDSATNRSLTGPGAQFIHSARQALWMMQTRPGICFRCGPLALDQILSETDPAKAANQLIFQSRSTTNGFSLAQVSDLSGKLGLNYQLAYRSQGASFIVPAVVHWKVGHYAALLKSDGGRFLIKDHTFHSSLWMTPIALAEEGSGYFLVPPGPLPSGWRAVTDHEAQAVWGKGLTSDKNANRTGPPNVQSGGNSQCGGMTTYTMNTMLASLCLSDTPVGYRPPVGPPVQFTATYNQNDANQPATFYYSNLGPDWTCGWIGYITDNPNSPGTDVTYYEPGGGTLTFGGFNSASQSYQTELMTQAILVKTSSSSYEMQFPNGAKKEFALSDGSTGTSRRIFLTQVIDPAGNPVQLNYDSSLRITNITDTIGQKTVLAYGNSGFPYAITSVTDPFGRTAHFQYNASGILIQITDVLGLISQYTYGSNNFVTALTTPYGTTTFSSGTTNGVTWLQATDPLGQSELLEATQNPVIPASAPAQAVPYMPYGPAPINDYLNDRDTFYWDKKAFQDGAGDYSKARIYHFLHETDVTTESGVLESVKQPLENWVWYDYPGENGSIVLGAQTINQPSIVGRVLDDGTQQIKAYQYNILGKITNSMDPVGRNFTYVYATNNVDLLQTIMTHNSKNELLGSITYNSQHEPLTVTDASGQTRTNAYNARGQLLSTRDPLGEMTTYSYDTNGYLRSITGPLQNSNDLTSFTYDGFGRVGTVTDTDGYTLTFSYDTMDRLTQVTHPDGTFEQFVYSNLDLVASSDRLARWTTNTYNADRQLVATRDPLGRTTSYDWCKCGALTGMTDAMGRTTTWDYDIQSRPIAKHYVDGSTITYIYENTTSRLQSRFDEKGQQTFYQYYADDNLESVSYPNAAVSTPTVTYSYDPDYNRVLTMQDGMGTTSYSYNTITTIPALGAGMLASVSGPLPNSTVTYQYDKLGRATNRAISGVAQVINYDVLGRPVTMTNALGTFRYSYLDATPRLAAEIYPNNQTNLYTYYGAFGDERLQRIQHLYPNGSLLSGSGYAYNAVGQITAWTNQWDAFNTRVWLPGYDNADQLTNVVSTGGPTSITNYSYAYDPAGNRLAAASNSIVIGAYYNALNQIASVNPGETNGVTYQWDAANRLIAVNQGVNRTEYSYDGLGRRVQILQKTNGVIETNNYLLWCGSVVCEERDATGGTTQKRYFDGGVQLTTAPVAGNYYYTRDCVGSITEMVDSSGAVRSRYDYDPYGQRSKLEGDLNSDWGFTSHFVDPMTQLYLAMFRAYDSQTGRWLSRDPIGEKEGANLYAYVANDPISRRDPLGLSDDGYGQDSTTQVETSTQNVSTVINVGLYAACEIVPTDPPTGPEIPTKASPIPTTVGQLKQAAKDSLWDSIATYIWGGESADKQESDVGNTACTLLKAKLNDDSTTLQSLESQVSPELFGVSDKDKKN